MRKIFDSIVLSCVAAMMFCACSNSKQGANPVSVGEHKVGDSRNTEGVQESKREILAMDGAKATAVNSIEGNWKCNDRMEYRIEIENSKFLELFLNRKNFEANVVKLEQDKDNPSRQNIILDTYDIMAGSVNGEYVFAKITSLYIENDVLHYTQELIPEYYNNQVDTYTFSRTQESRHGDVIMHPEIILQMQGKWKSEYSSFVIEDDVITMDDNRSEKIVVYAYKHSPDEMIIANEDAGNESIFGLVSWKFKGDTIEAKVMVMDADRWPVIVFHKE